LSDIGIVIDPASLSGLALLFGSPGLGARRGGRPADRLSK
jgi:hypothetical protein